MLYSVFIDSEKNGSCSSLWQKNLVYIESKVKTKLSKHAPYFTVLQVCSLVIVYNMILIYTGSCKHRLRNKHNNFSRLSFSNNKQAFNKHCCIYFF